MTDDRRDINTGGGDYEEVNNRGQYAKGSIHKYLSTTLKSCDHLTLSCMTSHVFGDIP